MKTTVKKGTVKLMPSVFALKKCYVNSRGVLKQFESKGPMRDCLELQSRPVLVKNETSIGVMGGMGSFEDETKHIYGNPQQGDTCALDLDCNTLEISFSGTFLPLTETLHATNEQAFGDAYNQFLQLYVSKKENVDDLATRLCKSIAQMSWLWRNQYGTDHYLVVKESDSGKTLVSIEIDEKIRTADFDSDFLGAQFDELKSIIADGLSGRKIGRVMIHGYVRLNYGQEVFPSQEFGAGRGSDNDGKNLAHDLFGDEKHARMHSQKISNRIKAIDTWYQPEKGFETEPKLPIPLEPYGSDLLRFGKESIYYILGAEETNGVFGLLENARKGIFGDDAHYAAAIALRGGVFNGESKKKDGKDES